MFSVGLSLYDYLRLLHYSAVANNCAGMGTRR